MPRFLLRAIRKRENPPVGIMANKTSPENGLGFLKRCWMLITHLKNDEQSRVKVITLPAFPVITRTLEQYFQDRKTDTYPVLYEEIEFKRKV